MIAALGESSQRTTVTPTVAQSGTTTNTVPGEALLSVDVRVASLAEQSRVDAAMQALTPALAGASVEIAGGPNRPPLESSASMELYSRAAALAARLGEAVPGAASVGGASDGNFTAGVGTPTLDGLGAVGGGAHADHEHVVIAALPGRTALLGALVEDLLAHPVGALETTVAGLTRTKAEEARPAWKTCGSSELSTVVRAARSRPP